MASPRFSPESVPSGVRMGESGSRRPKVVGMGCVLALYATNRIVCVNLAVQRNAPARAFAFYKRDFLLGRGRPQR
jgi:hypothetical protein